MYLFFRSMNLVIPITSLGPADPSRDDTQMEGQIRAAAALQPQHTHTCVSIEIGLACCSSCRVSGVVPKSLLNSLGPEWTRRCPSLLSYLASLVAVVGRMTESVISGV